MNKIENQLKKLTFAFFVESVVGERETNTLKWIGRVYGI